MVFADADDNYTPLKQVAVPMTSDWQMYQVDLTIPRYRHGHAVVITFWVGESILTLPLALALAIAITMALAIALS